MILPRRRAGALAVLSATALLTPLLATGCGDGGGGAAGATPARTVTVTTSGTATRSASSTPTATSDVKGRKHDLGTVSSASEVGGVLVVELDRWTLPGTSDSSLAQKGVQLTPHRGPRFTNQNTSKTYSAPVADGARVVVTTCVPGQDGELGLRSAPVAASTWLDDPDTRLVMVVTYDAAGAITKMESDPRCDG